MHDPDSPNEHVPVVGEAEPCIAGSAGPGGFPYQVFLLRCRFQGREFAGQWISNYIRGAFGKHLRHLTCVCPRPDGNPMVHMPTCPYSRIFESPTPADAQVMRRYTNVPHPFVIYPTDVSEDGEFTLELVLIGGANQYFPYFVMTFLRMAQGGLGPKRTPFEILGIESGGKPVYDPETNGILEFQRKQRFAPSGSRARRVRLELVSPLSLNREGTALQGWDTRTFVSALLRRIKNLAHFHADLDLQIDFTALIALAEQEVRVASDDTQWIARHRYSSRQGQVMRIGGLMGTVDLEGDLTRLLPYLELGTTIHNGKKTSFGNGKYVLSLEED